MAVNNSIALGKTKGSIGNVTFARLKGQQVSKSKIEAKGAILPANQSPAQIRMINVVMAYQFLAMFLQFAFGLRKPHESIFNAFVRLTKNLFSAIAQTSGYAAVYQLNGQSIYQSSFVTISDISVDGNSKTITLGSNNSPFIALSYLNILLFDASTGANIINNHLITEAEWNEGSIVLNIVSAYDQIIGYIYNTTTKKCSNIYYPEV